MHATLPDYLCSTDPNRSSDRHKQSGDFHGESSMLMYRKDLTDKAGIKFDDRPTWTEVRDAADGYRSSGAEPEGSASAPASAQALSLVGGGSRSVFWAQLLADVLGVPLQTHSGGEAGGALGAARLAWLADGGSEAEVCAAPPVARRFEPDAAAHAALARRAERFRRLYPALRDTFRT